MHNDRRGANRSPPADRLAPSKQLVLYVTVYRSKLRLDRNRVYHEPRKGWRILLMSPLPVKARRPIFFKPLDQEAAPGELL